MRKEITKPNKSIKQKRGKENNNMTNKMTPLSHHQEYNTQKKQKSAIEHALFFRGGARTRTTGRVGIKVWKEVIGLTVSALFRKEKTGFDRTDWNLVVLTPSDYSKPKIDLLGRSQTRYHCATRKVFVPLRHFWLFNLYPALFVRSYTSFRYDKIIFSSNSKTTLPLTERRSDLFQKFSFPSSMLRIYVGFRIITTFGFDFIFFLLDPLTIT